MVYGRRHECHTAASRSGPEPLARQHHPRAPGERQTRSLHPRARGDGPHLQSHDLRPRDQGWRVSTMTPSARRIAGGGSRLWPAVRMDGAVGPSSLRLSRAQRGVRGRADERPSGRPSLAADRLPSWRRARATPRREAKAASFLSSVQSNVSGVRRTEASNAMSMAPQPESCNCSLSIRASVSSVVATTACCSVSRSPIVRSRGVGGVPHASSSTTSG